MNIKKRTCEPLRQNSTRFDQSENSVLDYTVNWGPCVDDILTSEWSVSEGSLTISSESTDATNITASCFITGDVGEHILINKITTTAGQTDEHKLLIKINENDIPYIDNDYGL